MEIRRGFFHVGFSSTIFYFGFWIGNGDFVGILRWYFNLGHFTWSTLETGGDFPTMGFTSQVFFFTSQVFFFTLELGMDVSTLDTVLIWRWGKNNNTIWTIF